MAYKPKAYEEIMNNVSSVSQLMSAIGLTYDFNVKRIQTACVTWEAKWHKINQEFNADEFISEIKTLASTTAYSIEQAFYAQEQKEWDKWNQAMADVCHS